MTGNGTGGAAGIDAARRKLAAAVKETDEAALQDLLDEDFTAVDLQGRAHGPEAALAGLAGNAYGAELKPEIHDYGTAVLLTDRRPGDGGELTAIEVWVKRPAGWRLLTHHVNRIADPASPPPHPAHVARAPDAPPAKCPNPLQYVPYEATRDEERGVITAFQTLEDAVVRNDGDEWVPWVADEFIVFRTGQVPTTKAGRVEAMRRQKAINAEIFVAAVEAMRLWVFGDVVVMRADHLMPGNRRPPYRATRLWVRRDGRWQMAISQQTNRTA